MPIYVKELKSHRLPRAHPQCDAEALARALIESEDENRQALHHDCGVAQYH